MGNLGETSAEEMGLLARRIGAGRGLFPAQAFRAAGLRQVADPPFLPLLDLENALGNRGPLAAVVGITHDGRPLVIDLLSPGTSHVLAVACPAWGKSTLLRTLVGSLCLGTRPWQMGVLGMDLSGRELSILEAVPHKIAPMACDVGEAASLLGWLEKEMEARLDRQIASPAILLVVDDLQWLSDPDQASSLRRMMRTLRIGAQAGIHVLAALQDPPLAELAALLDAQGSVLAVGQGGPTRGVFTFGTRGWARSAQAAYLPAGDLNRLVARVSGRAVGTGQTMARAGTGEP